MDKKRLNWTPFVYFYQRARLSRNESVLAGASTKKKERSTFFTRVAKSNTSNRVFIVFDHNKHLLSSYTRANPYTEGTNPVCRIPLPAFSHFAMALYAASPDAVRYGQ